MYAALRRTVAPTERPVSLLEAKDHLRLIGDDEDFYVQRLVDAAVAQIDGTGSLGRAMITQTWAQWHNQSPGYVRLAMTPFQSLTAVEYYDADGILQTATLGDFETWLDGDTVRVKPRDNRAWPSADSRPDAIKITYVAGYGDTSLAVPETVRHAILLLVGHMYQNREAGTEKALSEIPFGVDALLSLERTGWFGA